MFIKVVFPNCFFAVILGELKSMPSNLPNYKAVIIMDVLDSCNMDKLKKDKGCRI